VHYLDNKVFVNMNKFPSCFLAETDILHTFENAARTMVCSIFISVIPVFFNNFPCFTPISYIDPITFCFVMLCFFYFFIFFLFFIRIRWCLLYYI